jgi:hypothetical protein
MQRIRSHGGIPLVSWSSSSISDPPPQAQLAARRRDLRQYDSFKSPVTRDARCWGHPLFLRFDWEMSELVERAEIGAGQPRPGRGRSPPRARARVPRAWRRWSADLAAGRAMMPPLRIAAPRLSTGATPRGDVVRGRVAVDADRPAMPAAIELQFTRMKIGLPHAAIGLAKWSRVVVGNPGRVVRDDEPVPGT